VVTSPDADDPTLLDALIIGAGPSGLFTAIELARRGVVPRIVDADSLPHRQSRATTIMPSTLMLLARAGLADQFIESGMRINCFGLRDAALNQMSAIRFEDLDTPMPFAITLPQWRTEELLAARLAELGVDVERGTTATDLDLRVDGTGVALESSKGRELVDTRALIGAGGAHSVVRSAMRQVLQGGSYDRRFAVADIVLPSNLPRDEVTRITSAGGVALLGPLPGDRTLAIFDLPDGDPLVDEGEPSLSDVQRLLASRLTVSLVPSDLRWSSCFTLHHRIAKSFGDIRRYLVGDAAHIESLFSGMGMNAGLHDAANLGWKLASCLRLEAHAGLLHTYVLERRPADERSLSISDAGYRSVMGDDVAPPAAMAPDAPGLGSDDRQSDPRRTVLMLDEHYEGSPLVGSRVRPGTELPVALTPGTLFPEDHPGPSLRHGLYLGKEVVPPIDFLGRWADLVEVVEAPPLVPPAGAVLVRPDGFIAFVALPADEAAFAQLDGMLGSWFTLPTWFRTAEAIR
jgi:2-polyprenyl-6-methoxyphenol hydroxylase-like FAD-dependent oxidoreductase